MYSLEQLYSLCRDRENETNEMIDINDYYGCATILKKHFALPENYRLKGSIEHCPDYDNFLWNYDSQSGLPATFVMSSHRANKILKHVSKPVFAIGPYIHYAEHALSKDQLDAEKRRLGRSLLGFPVHSTHHIKTQYDIEEYISTLKEIGKEFDSIRVNLYWKDILSGVGEKYLRHGIEVVSAGHLYDKMFLPRLKSIIETATVTVSNFPGTALCYSVFMDKPHFIIPMDVKAAGKNEFETVRIGDGCESAHVTKAGNFDLAYYDGGWEMLKMFSEFRYDITPEQKSVVDKYLGTADIKSPSEMIEILQITEDIYGMGKETYSDPRSVFMRVPSQYLKAGDKSKALMLFEQSTKFYPEVIPLSYCKALLLREFGRIEEAVVTLNEILEKEPGHKKAKNLLNNINMQTFDTGTKSVNRLAYLSKESIPENLHNLPSEIKQVCTDSYSLLSYSQEGEDVILRRFFEKQKNGFYVDVGAYHPMRFSNTYHFYKQGWHGINIDAMPGSMRAFHKWRQRDINLEIPVTSKNDELVYNIFNEPALNTFSKEIADRRNLLPGHSIIKTIKLETMPLSKILDIYLPAGQKIDFMNVDVEGLDAEVIKSNDWHKYRPKLVLVEQLGFSMNDIEQDEIYNLMTGFNYDFIARTINTSFFIDNTIFGLHPAERIGELKEKTISSEVNP